MGRRASHVAVARIVALLTIASGLLLAPACSAKEPLDAAAVQGSWTSLPLGDVAAQLTRITGVSVIVDRRIDPTRRVTFDAQAAPLGAVAAAVAAQADADVAILATTIRIAAPAVAAACEAGERLRAGERRRLPPAQRAVLDESAAWEWEAAATPRDLVAAAAAAAGIEIVGLETIPHDHFPAASLPPLPLADRLDLVLAHVDRRAAWSAAAPGGRPRASVVALPKPSADAPRNPRSTTAREPKAAASTFTLRVEAPLEEVVAAIAARLGLVVAIDEASLRSRGISPREIVRASVADASREQLLDAVLGPAGIRWRIDGGRLHVFAAPDR